MTWSWNGDLDVATRVANAHLQSVEAVQLALVVEVVRHGGTFTLQGNPGNTPAYQLLLSSPMAGRSVSSKGEDLAVCLHTLLVLWGKQ